MTSGTSTRAFALDALRGFAILAMILSGQLPFFTNTLPDWMYHAQVPPPLHQFIPTLPGITWVDLVFPFFLFSMGAAFPLALSRRLSRGASVWSVAGSILQRGFLLGFFALYVMAIRPHVISAHPTFVTWMTALYGYALLFPMLMRLPEAWPVLRRRLVRALGWVLGILLLATLRYPDGSGFLLTRSDIIIIVLTNMAVFGSLLWLFTRQRPLLRLGVLGILAAIRLSNMPAPVPGWVHDFWTLTPAPWIYTLYYLQYLFIVIPGMIAGDLLLEWMESGRPEDASAAMPRMKALAALALMLAFIPLLLVGMKARMTGETTIATMILCGAGWLLLRNPRTALERLFKELFSWAIYWLVLGLFFEPYEGGIKKDRATMSYYFITSGLAICLYIAFSIVIDVFGKKRALSLLIDNGQNPMIAYAGVNNFIIPILGATSLLSLSSELAVTPWLGFARGAVITLLLALFVQFCTKKHIFWRT